MAFLFREHRGSLEESILTMVLFRTKKGLISHCQELLRPFGMEVTDVLIKPYSSRPDKRVGWKRTFIVTVEGYGVIGFTNSDPG